MASRGRLLVSARNEPPGDTGGDVVITVEDQGCGIAPDDLDGIFQPFRSTFEKGTGLGLPIVHRIVTDYSGVIHVSSTVGSGTSVHVRLPHRAGSSAEAASGGTSADVSLLREVSRRAVL